VTSESRQQAGSTHRIVEDGTKGERSTPELTVSVTSEIRQTK
jgi:hypothetical protein